MTVDRIKRILDFWFEGVDDKTLVDKNRRPFVKWFIKDALFDKTIQDTFEPDLKKAIAGQYKDWEENPKGSLALIVLYDQFTRNMYRGDIQMYAFDTIAQRIAMTMVQEGWDKELPMIQRVFLYMPLMHAENLKSQEFCVHCFSQLLKECQQKNPHNIRYYQYSLDYARKHEAIIRQFGRFPHRNRILKRISTPAEKEFLQKPGAGF